MLKEWFRGSSQVDEVKSEKAPARMVLDAEKPLETPESIRQRRIEAYEKKLAESAKGGPPSPSRMVTYDSFFRKVQGILLEGGNNEMQEGISLNVSRNVQNTLLSTKWVLVNPQMSHWEVNLQMNGFTDLMAVSWSTLNRYQLTYQRMVSTGAMLVTQFMAQKQANMCQGTALVMLQYPWWFGGCTQVQYLKDQFFTLSHAQRIIRGVHVGTNLNVDPNTHASSLSHAISLMTPQKDAGFMAEITPSKGTWTVAASVREWGTNTDAAISLEYKEGREGMATALNLGCRKSFIGGAELVSSILGFRTVKISLDLPFGGEMPGVNQFRVGLTCNYDVHSGALKQGLTFTA